MPRKVSLICACSASVFLFVWGGFFTINGNRDDKQIRLEGGMVGWGRTGSGDRCGVLLIRTLHLFFECSEARGLHKNIKKKRVEHSMSEVGILIKISKGLVVVAYLDFFRLRRRK